MKTSHPQLALASSLLLLAALLLASCQGRSMRETLGLGISRTVTHIAAGESARLIAYEEYREAAQTLMSVQAASPGLSRLRSPVLASWSVSDPSIAYINDDGTLTALKPGRITVTCSWRNYTATTVIEVIGGLPHLRLPQLSARYGSVCRPQAADLTFDEDRSLSFRMSFDGCEELEVQALAPEAPLPWRLEREGLTLEIREARGPIVQGVVRMRDEEVSFIVWSTGAGAYPVSLSGRRVLVIGDSMAQGLAPFLQRKVEAAGGRLLNAAEQSSTILWWQGSGKLRALIAQHRPDIIFIALGSNELFVKDSEMRAPLIRSMAAEIGSREAYWVGPPSWKPGSKLLPVIEENFLPRRFYNSDNLNVPRGKDGKHPTLEGYERWVESIWSWYARTL